MEKASGARGKLRESCPASTGTNAAKGNTRPTASRLGKSAPTTAVRACGTTWTKHTGSAGSAAPVRYMASWASSSHRENSTAAGSTTFDRRKSP
jgi:hypothetical protein